jgi:uncharacterized protein (DUF983 family)
MVETPREREIGENAAAVEPRVAKPDSGPRRRAAPGPRAPTPSPPATRNLAPAVWLGLLRRCPNCGEGALFRSYLGLNPRCPACGEDLTAERADDAPAFVTLFVCCFVGGAGVLLSDAAFPQMPLLASALLWLAVTAAVGLLILPRIKGAVVGAEWALRMHGFGAAGARAEPARGNARAAEEEAQKRRR